MPEKDFYMRIEENKTEDGRRMTTVTVHRGEDDAPIVGSTVEREYYRSERKYRREVLKAINCDLGWIGKIATRESIFS